MTIASLTAIQRLRGRGLHRHAQAEITPTGRPTRRIRLDWTTVAAIGVLAFLVLLALGADFLSEYLFKVGPTVQDLRNAYGRPDPSIPARWLGSDELGRSQIVRLIYAARVSLAVGIGAAVLNMTLGVALGIAAGYWRGLTDDVVQWLVGTLRSVPSLFLLLTIAVLFQPGPWTLVIVLGLLSWQGTALFVRGQTFKLREQEMVQAARALGASDWRVMIRHILPNLLSLVITLAAIDVGSIILAESALSFLGLGIMPPMASWGNMLTNAAGMMSRAPWLVWGPGGMIFLAVLSLYLIGDGLRDALDPHLRSSARPGFSGADRGIRGRERRRAS